MSIIDKLQKDSEKMKELITELIIKHSAIERWNDDRLNRGIAIMTGDYRWKALSVEGKQLQSRILSEYKKFYSIVEVLSNELPQGEIKKLEAINKKILQELERGKTLWDSSKEKHLEGILTNIDNELQSLEAVYTPVIAENIYVPDTNALLTNPDIEDWSFEGIKEFTIVILPTVLSELDVLKVAGRTEDLRDKSKKIVRKFKEYRKRGDMFAGVKLAGKNKICTIAVEPNFEKTLPWLDSDNNDDRIIASYFEVVKKNIKSNVVLVTGDFNMQNKASYAGVLFDETPEVNA